MTNPNREQLVGRIEEDPIAQQLPERPTFIPLRHYDLKRTLIDSFALDETDERHFLSLCNQLQSFFHIEHQSTLLRMEELYERLDPDSQLVEVDELEPRHGKQLGNWLIDHVADLLYSAHYKRLSRDELERAIDVGWQWGVRLDVNFEIFDRLEIFARGYRTVEVHRRRWQNFYRRESIELPEFTRLIMAFRVKEIEGKGNPDFSLDPRYVYLKTFKNIPETDLEILLPGSKVKLSKLDRAKILVPTLSGLTITGFKFFRTAVIVGLAFSWKTWFGFAVLIGGGVGYIVKSVLSYFRTKSNYQFGLTKSLYLKNLDNNLSVLYRILNEAEEQEISEAILAYSFLWKSDAIPVNGISAAELDRLIESYLQETTGLDVDFEVHDALGKLARLNLASVNSDGRWTVISLEHAQAAMAVNWQELFQTASRAFPAGPIPRQPNDSGDC